MLIHIYIFAISKPDWHRDYQYQGADIAPISCNYDQPSFFFTLGLYSSLSFYQCVSWRYGMENPIVVFVCKMRLVSSLYSTFPGTLYGIQRRQSRISHPTAASVKYSRYSATHTNSKETSSRKWTSPHIATMDQKNNYIFETYTSKAFIWATDC